MATSYISEHSAEYYLVPALKAILQEQYSHIAPVFPWISREFSNISKHLHKDDWFHVLVMFPRRPKFNAYDNCEVYVTINRELEYFNNAGKEKGVPVIAGCPMAVNIWDLSSCDTHAWINLDQVNSYEYLNSLSNLKENRCLLEKDDILSLVRKSTIFNLNSFEDFFRHAKETQPDRMYGGQYKPVYFLIKTR